MGEWVNKFVTLQVAIAENPHVVVLSTQHQKELIFTHQV